MKRLFLIWITSVLGVQLHAQNNLVPNGGFEDPYRCPNTTQGNLMNDCFSDWATPTIGSPDYYSFCADFSYFRPDGAGYGEQFPLQGEAFIGMYSFSLNQPEGREYAQVQLNEPMHAGVRYKVSFNVSLAELSRYAVSSLGVYLSEEPPSRNDYWVIDVEAQIQNPAGNIIADTSGWVLVTDTFTSRTSGEQWLTIGNFNYAADSDTFAFQPPNPDMGGSYFSYYYIDDVSVVALDNVPNSIEETERLNFSVYPNPAKDVLHISGNSQLTDAKLLDMAGREVLRSTGNLPLQMDIRHLPKGLYLIEVNNNGRKAVRKVVVQ